MSWQGPNISFWLITLLVLSTAIYATFAKSILRAAFGLFFTLFGMAGYYVLLGSDFVAVTQVIIYVGGILVLLVFGVLLTNRSFPHEEQPTVLRLVLFGVPGVALFIILAFIIKAAAWQQESAIAEPVSSVRAMGEMLLGPYLGALLIAGVTLLLCLVGAAYLVRRER